FSPLSIPQSTETTSTPSSPSTIPPTTQPVTEQMNETSTSPSTTQSPSKKATTDPSTSPTPPPGCSPRYEVWDTANCSAVLKLRGKPTCELPIEQSERTFGCASGAFLALAGFHSPEFKTTLMIYPTLKYSARSHVTFHQANGCTSISTVQTGSKHRHHSRLERITILS
ncbi:hypothetical protein PMAYCL1PPCAC_28004, partial [Pristionchus mayeri]